MGVGKDWDWLRIKGIEVKRYQNVAKDEGQSAIWG